MTPMDDKSRIVALAPGMPDSPWIVVRDYGVVELHGSREDNIIGSAAYMSASLDREAAAHWYSVAVAGGIHYC